MQTGRGFTIKPTRKQIEGGFLGTLASIGIPIAISLVSKMLGGGLQVDRRGSSNTANVYVPPTHGTGYPYLSPPFIGTWSNPIGMGVKKKKLQRKRSSSRKKQPIQLNSHTRNNSIVGLNHSKLHFVIKPLSNFDLMEWIKRLGIKHFR